MTQLAATFPNDDVLLLDNCKMFRSFVCSFVRSFVISFFCTFPLCLLLGSVSERPAIIVSNTEIICDLIKEILAYSMLINDQDTDHQRYMKNCNVILLLKQLRQHSNHDTRNTNTNTRFEHFLSDFAT